MPSDEEINGINGGRFRTAGNVPKRTTDLIGMEEDEARLMAARLSASESVKARELNELEERLEQAGIVRPPDGGYGWIVVLASFCSNAVVDGIIFTVSASLVPRWEQSFHSNAVTTITALLAGFYLLSGPLASALANSFGCNKVAMAGSFIAALGFLISALIPALPVLYFAFGIIGGLGFGLVFLPAIVIVGQYFSEKRALATGIAVCGSGIGTAIFGQLNPILLAYFDQITGPEDSWRIFLVFLSGTTLSCAFFGYFFKPLKPSKAQLEQVVRITEEFMGMEEADRRKRSTGDERRESSVVHSGQHVTQGVEFERIEKAPQNGSLERKRQDSFSQRPFLSTLELLASQQALDRPSQSNANLAREVSKVGLLDLNRPLSRMDIFYGGSSLSLANRMGRRPTEGGEAGKLADLEATRPTPARSIVYLSSAGLQNQGEASRPGIITPKWTHGIFASLRSMLDLSLLQSPTFIILAFSGFLTLSCFFVPFAFLGALADETMDRWKGSANANANASGRAIGEGQGGAGAGGGGNHNSSQLLLVLLGLFNVAGRVLCGFISDHPKVDPLIVSNMALIIGGIATALAPWLDQLWQFALYCLPFAFGAASFAALRSIICVELLGIERLTSAFGMLLLFMGVAALLGPPFARLLKDFTGSYGLSFHIMGLMMAASGALCLPLRKINAWENQAKDQGTSRDGTRDRAGANGTELQALNSRNNK